MGFFNTQPADDNHASPAPEEGQGAHPSLSEYISRHFASGATEEAGAAQAPTQASRAGQILQTPFRTSRSEIAGGAGMVLNRLDVELPAGLERYLPTPVFRLRVVKKRLDGEIAELRMRLNKYERLNDPAPELRERIAALRERVVMLETHERVVSEELAAILRFGPFMVHLSRAIRGLGSGTASAGAGLNGWFRRLVHGEAYLAMEAAGEQLRVLEGMMADQLRDPLLSGVEIARIVNRYEQALKRFEGLRAGTSSRRG